MGTHERIGNIFVEQLRHLGKSFRLFGIIAVVLLVVLGSLAVVKNSNKAAAEEGSAQHVQADTAAAPSATEPAPAASAAVPATPTAPPTPQATAPAIQTGWYIVDGVRYYYLSDGSMATGTVNIQGVNCTFDESGHWVSSRLDVPYLSQLPDMPSGCELVSVTMMLNYAKVKVTKEQLAEKLPYADDPNLGFTGSLYEEGGYNSGGIIWPVALLSLVQSYKASAIDLSGHSWEEIRNYLNGNKPVCIWFRADGLDHTVLLVGYSDTEVWLNDPLVGKDIAMDINLFMANWSASEYRALSY